MLSSLFILYVILERLIHMFLNFSVVYAQLRTQGLQVAVSAYLILAYAFIICPELAADYRPGG